MSCDFKSTVFARARRQIPSPWPGSTPEENSAMSPGWPSAVVNADEGTSSPSVRRNCVPGTKLICASGNSAFKPVENGDSMGRSSVVIAQQIFRLIGQRTDQGDIEFALLQRKGAIVLEQHHGLIGNRSRQRPVLRAVQFLLDQFSNTGPSPADRTCPASSAP